VFVFCLYRWMLVYMLGMPMMLFMKGWSANFSVISLSTVCPLGKKVHFSSMIIRDHLEYMVSVSFDVVVAFINCKKSKQKINKLQQHFSTLNRIHFTKTSTANYELKCNQSLILLYLVKMDGFVNTLIFFYIYFLIFYV